MTDLKDINFSEDDFDKDQVTKSPKEMLIDFVKKTNGHEKNYVFSLEGNADDAKRYIHRMRVELSRFRAEIHKQNKKPVPFKIFKKDIFHSDGTCEVHLFRGEEKPLSKEIDSLLDSISLDKTPKGI